MNFNPQTWLAVAADPKGTEARLAELQAADEKAQAILAELAKVEATLAPAWPSWTHTPPHWMRARRPSPRVNVSWPPRKPGSRGFGGSCTPRSPKGLSTGIQISPLMGTENSPPGV
jgi:hypothetical protein